MIQFTKRDDYNWPYAIRQTGDVEIVLSEHQAKWLLRRLANELSRGDVSERLRVANAEIKKLRRQVKVKEREG